MVLLWLDKVVIMVASMKSFMRLPTFGSRYLLCMGYLLPEIRSAKIINLYNNLRILLYLKPGFCTPFESYLSRLSPRIHPLTRLNFDPLICLWLGNHWLKCHSDWSADCSDFDPVMNLWFGIGARFKVFHSPFPCSSILMLQVHR